uniref:ACOX domain-containing protein n=1 Tax=Macrostomum lignano TaxID=282301 RepID=A0A1I8F4N7_9PLAT
MGSTKRAARDVDGASGRIRTRTLPFPLPIAVTNLPTIDSAAVEALEVAYGGVRFPQELPQTVRVLPGWNAILMLIALPISLNGGTGATKNAATGSSPLFVLWALNRAAPFDFLLCYGAASSSNDKATVLEYDWLTQLLRKLLTQIAAKCDSESDKQTRLTLLEPVDELVTLVQFANDEGDPGMGLELGLDLLSVPTKIGCYDDLIEGLLATGYGLVGRISVPAILSGGI